jgi:hypothetical protein
MDKEFLIDHVMRVIKPLDVERIMAAPGFLSIVATDANSGEACTFRRFNNIDHFFRILKATICLPIIAGPRAPRS